jgi:thiamine transport system ATP-binding protein
MTFELRSGGTGVALETVRMGLGAFAVSFDLAVAAGTLAAVVGPSGAGKSTLLNLVAGFATPLSGTVRIGDADVTRLGPAERPVSMVFQENNLFAHLDIRTNVGLGLDPGLKLGAKGWLEVEAALARVGLPGFGKRRPGELSGGERQRVAIARSLVRRRPVLLLDEPFAALGPGLKADMLALIRALHGETGMTVLMVTHQPADAVAIADREIFVREGRIAASGPAEGFFQRGDVEGLSGYLGKKDT